jgi:hypothetical protein
MSHSINHLAQVVAELRYLEIVKSNNVSQQDQKNQEVSEKTEEISQLQVDKDILLRKARKHVGEQEGAGALLLPSGMTVSNAYANNYQGLADEVNNIQAQTPNSEHPLYLLANAIFQTKNTEENLVNLKNSIEITLSYLNNVYDQLDQLKNESITVENRILELEGCNEICPQIALPPGMTLGDALASNYQGLSDKVDSILNNLLNP